MTLTAASVKAFGFGGSLSDDSINSLIAAAYAAIDQRLAGDASMRESFTVHGPLIVLSRATQIVSTITENGIALDASDYAIHGTQLLRLSNGTHPNLSWRGVVDVSYIPVEADSSLRDAVALQLVKLDLTLQPGLTQRTIGNYSESFGGTDEGGVGGYQLQREAILSALREPAFML
jgi:hypothetical protein